MRRAFLDRPMTLHEWRERPPVDEGLSPGFYRKGRRARGCPKFCVHCRALKARPTRRQARAEVAWREWRMDGM